jgi:hypothetical protein
VNDPNFVALDESQHLDESQYLDLKAAYARHLEEFGEEASPAAEQIPEVALVACFNHEDRFAAVEGPDGEPLCEPCAVALAKRIQRAQKQVNRQIRKRSRLAGAAPSVKSRG